jgi:hypothetical protein
LLGLVIGDRSSRRGSPTFSTNESPYGTSNASPNGSRAGSTTKLNHITDSRLTSGLRGGLFAQRPEQKLRISLEDMKVKG